MEREIILCIPGPWSNRSKLLEDIIVRSEGKFMCVGGILACPSENDHIQLEYEEHTPNMEEAFRLAGQGKISEETLVAINQHEGVAYLHFPLEFLLQRERINVFTSFLRDCGGIAIKNESCGIAHEWDRWFELIGSEDIFDSYCACVVLIASKEVYYSCGMHNFCLPDVQVCRDSGLENPAKFINDFNLYQILEEPNLKSGDTFSLSDDDPIFRMKHLEDTRHDSEHLFHNPSGLWSLENI